MFWSNLKAIIHNLPLILSDTYLPEDISMHRVMAFFYGFNLVIMAYLLFFIFPQALAHSVTGVIFGSLTTLLGTYILANIGKRYLRIKEEEVKNERAKDCGDRPGS